MGPARKRSISAGLVIGMVIGAFAWAQEDVVPPSLQVPLLLKMLRYDKQFTQRAGDVLVVGVVYQEQFRESLTTKRQIVSALSPADAEKIMGVPVEWRALDLPDTGSLEALRDDDLDLIYLTPLKAIPVAEVLAVAEAQGTPTCAGSPEMVREGVAFGTTVRRGKPALIVNQKACKAQGVAFSTNLLKLAILVGET